MSGAFKVVPNEEWRVGRLHGVQGYRDASGRFIQVSVRSSIENGASAEPNLPPCAPTPAKGYIQVYDAHTGTWEHVKKKKD